jgi:hypothetical protein
MLWAGLDTVAMTLPLNRYDNRCRATERDSRILIFRVVATGQAGKRRRSLKGGQEDAREVTGH